MLDAVLLEYLVVDRQDSTRTTEHIMTPDQSGPKPASPVIWRVICVVLAVLCFAVGSGGAWRRWDDKKVPEGVGAEGDKNLPPAQARVSLYNDD
jgi:hypothetical protein